MTVDDYWNVAALAQSQIAHLITPRELRERLMLIWVDRERRRAKRAAV